MKLIISNTILIASVALFTSCEGGTTYTKVIENQSADTINVKAFSIIGNNETTVINPGESKIIYLDYQMDSFAIDTYYCTQEIDSIQVTVSNSKILIKEIMDAGNWTSTSSDGRNSKEECNFTITNEDIQ